MNVLCLFFMNINCYPPFSAGAGRTGAIITIHAMMQMAEEKKEVDIYNFVFSMRNSRPNIVQTSVSIKRIEVLFLQIGLIRPIEFAGVFFASFSNFFMNKISN